MIELVEITQHYGLRPVLRNVSLKVLPGRLTAIVGPNGMGKTTLLKVMAGVLAPQAGYVEIGGLRRRRTVEEENGIRRIVCWLPDHPWLPLERTGREFLIDVALIYGAEITAAIEHAERLLQLFELVREGDWPIRSCSNGQKKKIAVAAALATQAEVLLLDELFGGGLDPAGIAALRSVLKHLTKEVQRTLVMTAPVPELVDGLADDFIVLVQGEVLAHDSLEGLRRRTGCDGSLSEVLTKLTNPRLTDRLQTYLTETGS